MTPKNWLIVAGLGVALLLGTYLSGRHNGKLAQQDADAQHQEQSIKDTIRVRDSVFVHDTVKLTVVRHRTDSLVRVDTLLRADTVRQLVAAERQACDLVVQSCEAKVAARDSLNANLNLQINLLRKQHPSRFSCVVGPSLGTAGKPEVSATCGIRIH